MHSLWSDIKYALKMLAKNPGFTAAAVLILAIGIGANSAIFSVLNAVLLRSLPYPEAGRLVWVWERTPGGEKGAVPPPDYLDYRQQARSFEQLAAYMPVTHNVTDLDNPERLSCAATSGNFFDTLGVRPLLGRGFTVEEEQAGREPAVVLSHALWRQRYGADPSILGRKLLLDGQPFTVVGVMPADFNFPKGAALWEVAPFHLKGMSIRKAHFLRPVGRLRPGVSIEAAQSEVNAIAGRLAEQYPDSNRGHSLRLVSLNEYTVGDIRTTLLLAGAVGFVLLMACANVANLLLARATARGKEMAVRAALGAGRGRLVRQLLTESVILALVGGVLGVLLAYWGTGVLVKAVPDNIPRLDEAGIDGSVLAFTVVASVLTGVVFGLAPALRISRPDLNGVLKQAGRGSTGGGRGNLLRNALVTAQIALALVLLVGAGLMIKSFSRLHEVSPGFNPDNLLTMQIELPAAKYPKPQQRANFFHAVVERVSGLPGVVAAGTVSELPLSGQLNDTYFYVEGRGTDPARDRALADFRTVSAGYFRAMQIPLKRGREFTEQEVSEGARVVVVNESIANRFFGGEDPTGKRLLVETGERTPYEVVGVVGDIRQRGLDSEVSPEMYMPQYRAGATSLVVRTARDPESLAASVRGAVRAVDADQPVANVRTMGQIIDTSVTRSRFRMLLFSVFAAAALILASVGIYGVIAYSVAQRTHEIGIRMALGAEPGRIFRSVLGGVLKVALAGLFLGLVLSLALTRLLSTLLYGVSATDPLTFLWVSPLLVGVALAASLVPAYRATRVDPLVALRE
jgi:putative ABC transport system permease protein